MAAKNAGKKMDDNTLITSLFDFGSLPPEDAAVMQKTKDVLREHVVKSLVSIENGFGIDYKNMIPRLKNWRFEKDKTLANDLHELSQEVAQSVMPSGAESADKSEMMAVHELVAE